MDREHGISRTFSIFVEITSICIAFGTIASSIIYSYIFSYNGFRYLSIATISDIFRDGIGIAVNIFSTTLIIGLICLGALLIIISRKIINFNRIILSIFSISSVLYFVSFSIYVMYTTFIEQNYTFFFRYSYIFYPEYLYGFSILLLVCSLFFRNQIKNIIKVNLLISSIIVGLAAIMSIFLSFIDIQNRFKEGASDFRVGAYQNRNVIGVTSRGAAAEACKEKSIGGFVGAEPLYTQAELLWLGERAAIIQCKDMYDGNEGIMPNMFRKAIIINPGEAVF